MKTYVSEFWLGFDHNRHWADKILCDAEDVEAMRTDIRVRWLREVLVDKSQSILIITREKPDAAPPEGEQLNLF